MSDNHLLDFRQYKFSELFHIQWYTKCTKWQNECKASETVFPRKHFVKVLIQYIVNSYGCSNVAKLSWNKNIFFRKKYVWFLQNYLFLQKKLFASNKYLYPLSKNLILLKKSMCKKNHDLKQTHSVKQILISI